METKEMKIVLLDAEANGFLPEVNKLWCICTEDTNTGEQRDFIFPKDEYAFYQYASTVDRWVIHNGSAYDGPVISKLIPKVAKFFTIDKIIDTLVISRVTNYKRMMSHSLKNWGLMLGIYKGEWNDFSKWHPDMLVYCRGDVDTLKGVWSKLKKFCVGTTGAQWKDAFDLEKAVNAILSQVQQNGFAFNTPLAIDILDEVSADMLVLEAEFQKIWPPVLEVVKTLKYRTTKDGKEFKTVTTARMSYPKTVINGDTLECYDYIEFSPASPQQRIDKLWDAGWNPTEKTKTHYKVSKERNPEPVRWARLQRYGWKCSEENLKTLPRTAPKGATALAQWLTLEGRRSSLAEWLGCVKMDGRIHGNTMHIGAWTHRCSHSGPNTANISRPWPKGKTPETAVDIIKEKYDSRLRSCWVAEHGKVLVGTDADGIQLRILAHYMKSEDYKEAILKGDKADGTDIHSVNRKALGSICKSRDDSKTFIYAWLLGAGVVKVSQILGCTVGQAGQAVKNFLAALPELAKVKDLLVPRDAARGYFLGVDGRKVVQPEAYLMLAGYLQNGESTIMKKAMVRWYHQAIAEDIPFKLVTFVHDEWQCEVADKTQGERLGQLQREALEWAGEELGMFCPMEGSTDIGNNWLQTH